MKIELPLPSKDVSPNARVHYMVKAKATAAMREHAKFVSLGWMAVNDHTFPWGSAVMQLAFYFKTAGRRDPDNLLASCKAYIDGLRDAKVLEDDDQITYLPVMRHKDKDNPRLELWVGGFEDFNEPRGGGWSLDDIAYWPP